MATRYQETFDLIGKRPKARNERGVWVRRPRNRSKHFDEALDVLTDGSVDPRERWRATRALIVTIWWIQGDFAYPEEPPSVPEVRKLLDTIESASRTLTRRVGELDDLIVDLMHSRPSDLLNPSKLREYRRHARIGGAHADPCFNQSELLESLSALQKACRLIRETYLDERRPGTRLATVGVTNPKFHLVKEAASLFAEFRPADLRATWRGPFHIFCAALYELITGKDSKGPGVGLRRYVDFVAPLMRRLHDLSERRIYLMFPGPSRHFRDGVDERIHRLTVEIETIWADLEKGPFRRR